MKAPIYTEARLQSSGFRQFVDCTRIDGTATYHMWLNADGTPENTQVHKNRNTPGASFAQRHFNLSLLRGEGKAVAAHMLAAVTPEALAILAQGREADERAQQAERKASALRHRAAMAGPDLMLALAEMVRTEMFLSDHPQRQAAYDTGRALLARIESGAA